ncbi:radial spoke head protein, putative [Plasmodium ovale]|uniref:Radial spoke head protein, putative n=1 Tax=Plasmodium ovale TaxID=36330 RepID=A0A1C3KS27_PLAOA|nr:radial spoke head protein, putative [Plasmodium ovale]
MKSSLVLSLNNAKDYLKERDEEGNSVYEHICDLINFLVVERPNKCYANFELISNHIKECKRDNNVRKARDITSREAHFKDSNLDNYILTDYLKKKKEWLEKTKLLLQQRCKTKRVHLPFLMNFYEQVRLMNWAGYSIKNDLIFHISKSMKSIIQKYKDELESLTFWGILKGTQNDYYILEGRLKADSAMLSSRTGKFKPSRGETDDSQSECAEAQGSEESGSDSDEHSDGHSYNGSGNFPYGKENYDKFHKKVNRYVYWASTNGMNKWLLLKCTRPECIEIASKANKMVTGDINHVITSFPNIEIKEKHYLRAVISIISSHTHISPQYYYQLKGKRRGGTGKVGTREAEKEDEDDGEERDDEEDEEGEEDMAEGETEGETDGDGDELVENTKFQGDPHILSNVENWVHCKHHLLPNGHVHYTKVKPAKGVRRRSGDDSGDDSDGDSGRGSGRGSGRDSDGDSGGDSESDARGRRVGRSRQIEADVRQNPPLKILRSVTSQGEGWDNHTWKVKHLNEGHYYGVSNAHYDVIVIYNFLYYGAFTVYHNGHFFNFYVGNGIRSKHAFIHTYQPGRVHSDQSELSEEDQTQTS